MSYVAWVGERIKRKDRKPGQNLILSYKMEDLDAIARRHRITYTNRANMDIKSIEVDENQGKSKYVEVICLSADYPDGAKVKAFYFADVLDPARAEAASGSPPRGRSRTRQ
jgi:hypothetical protein